MKKGQKTRKTIYLKTDIKANRYILTKPISYKEITVPAGYQTDGLTKGVNKYQPKAMRGAVVHDYNCVLEIVSRKQGDKYALEIWKADGVSWFKRTRWYLAIRAYSIVTFKK